MKHIKKNLLQAVLWLMLGLVPQLAWAEVPNVINYQGYLTDSSGSPLKGTVNITLTFWDALTAGNTVGSPKSYTNVEVNNGVLSQNVDVSDITFDKPVYVETTVNGETLSPRQLVTSVPAAYRAKKAADADKLDGVDSSDFITSETDPTVPANLKDGVNWNEIANRPAGLDNGDDVGVTSESDPTVPANLKDGVSWSEISNRPAGLDDGDGVGITAETDPQVGSNTSNYVPKWNGSALVKGTIYDNGKIGIGTIPSESLAKLEVNGGAYIKENLITGKPGYRWIFHTQYWKPSPDFLTIAPENPSANTEGWDWTKNFTLSRNGNVGIGTMSPGAKLEVAGAAQVDYLKAGTINIGSPKYTNSNLNFITLNDGTNRLGVISTRGWHFTARGDGYAETEERNDLGLFFWDGTNWNSRMFFDHSGNVGIGTAGPSYKLHVNGTAYATGAAGALSDRRHKENISDIPNDALKVVKELRPVIFEWKEPQDNGMEGSQFGFIAQEVEKVLPEAVLTQDNEEQTKGLKYNALIPVLTKAVQVLAEENETLKSENAALEARLERLEALLNVGQ